MLYIRNSHAILFDERLFSGIYQCLYVVIENAHCIKARLSSLLFHVEY